MEEQQPISKAPRAPLIAKTPSVPWWKQRSKRQTRWVRVDKPRRRPRSAKKPPPQPVTQAVKSTVGATQAGAAAPSTSNDIPGSSVPASKAKAKRRRKQNRMLVLDKWVSDSLKQSEAPNGHVVLDSWVNESVIQSTRAGEEGSDEGCGQEDSGDHVTNKPPAVEEIEESQPINYTTQGQPDRGLTANELIKIFRRKPDRRKRGGVKKVFSSQQQVASQRQKRPVSGDNTTALEHSRTMVKLEDVSVKLEPHLVSPLLPPPRRPPLLSCPPMTSTWPSISSVTPMTSSSNVLKRLPPFSGLTSTFDTSLLVSDHVLDVDPSEQPVNAHSYLSNPHLAISDHPMPLLGSVGLTSRLYPPSDDDVTHPLPLKRIAPEKVDKLRTSSMYQDHLQPGHRAGTVLTTSVNPDLTIFSPNGINDGPFSQSSLMSVSLPQPLLAHSPPRLSRQLKITSFLSPPKKRLADRLEPPFSTSLTSSAAGHVGLSARPSLLASEGGYGYGTTVPSSLPSYFPSSEPRVSSSGVPLLPRLSSQDSVFNRLESHTKLHQSRLQFSADPQRALELARDIHDDPFSRLGPSVTSRNALPMSVLGDSYASGGAFLPPLEVNQRRQRVRSDDLCLEVDSRFPRPSSDVVVKLEPGVVKYELDKDSHASLHLYDTRRGGYDVEKLLKRYAPKRSTYDATDFTSHPQPGTSYATVKQEREVKNISSVDSQHPPTSSGSGERFVDIQDSVRHVQIPGSSQTIVNLSQRTVSEALIDDNSERNISITEHDNGDDDVDYVRHVESTPIHIPLSRKGLKVVAIDCEMVGCVNKIPPEQMLASNLKGVGARKAGQMNKGGLGGVLQKTRMKPQTLTKKNKKQKTIELSVAARCSIIGYDGSILYDKYINPTIGTNYKIIHYRTPWSGIKPSHMKGATPFKAARREILNILQGCVVVGHNIGSDLHSLEIYHLPAARIRDTSIHPTLKKRAGMPANKQPGALKVMSLTLLGRKIQTKSRVGHCSVEDATATMDLYKLVELEWED